MAVLLFGAFFAMGIDVELFLERRRTPTAATRWIPPPNPLTALVLLKNCCDAT